MGDRQAILVAVSVVHRTALGRKSDAGMSFGSRIQLRRGSDAPDIDASMRAERWSLHDPQCIPHTMKSG